MSFAERDICREAYRNFVERSDLNTELKRSLRHHERVPVFIDNLARQFRGCKFPITKDMMVRATEDLTLWFIRAVEQQAQERIMSDMEKLTLKAAEAAKDEFRQMADALTESGGENVEVGQKGETSYQEVNADKIIR